MEVDAAVAAQAPVLLLVWLMNGWNPPKKWVGSTELLHYFLCFNIG